MPGYWEGDLLFGSHNSQITMLVERRTRYVVLVKVAGEDTQTVINALIDNARRLPHERYKPLTWDRGKEMVGHKLLQWRLTSRSISAIHKILGSAARMKIQTGC